MALRRAKSAAASDFGCARYPDGRSFSPSKLESLRPKRDPPLQNAGEASEFVHASRAEIRRTLRDPQEVLREIKEEYVESVCKEGLLRFSHNDTKRVGYEQLDSTAVWFFGRINSDV